MELARKSFGDALRDGATPPEVKKECKELLATVKRIEES
jgi:hypothetical protein